jgi:serine/threonine-protein kinase
LSLDLENGLHLGERPLAQQTEARPVGTAFVLSPDGRHLVYVGHDGTSPRLYHRALDQDRGVPLPGTEGAALPVFSPDSREVLFFTLGTLGREAKRVAIAGGQARAIATSGVPEVTDLPGQATWTDDDWIVRAGRGGIVRFPAGGGALETLIAGDPVERFASAQVLPGSRAVLFNVVSGEIPSQWDIVVQSVGSKDRRVVVSGGSDPRYVESGHILFMRRGSILAVPFDVATLQTTGDPVAVVDNVMHAERGGNSDYRTGLGHFAVSPTGTLAYLPGGVMRVEVGTMHWVSRQGATEQLPIPPARMLHTKISPDGSRLVWSHGSDGERTIWIFDVLRGVSRPVTSSGNMYRPVWSPDGRKLAVLASRDNGPDGVALLDVDGSAVPQFVGPTDLSPSDWSVNNILVLLGRDVWTMTMDGKGQASKFFEAASGTRPTNPRFSPDGRFLSYGSNETGRSEVYVRPFPAGTPVTRVSVNGGTSSAWSNDGRQLFYRQSGAETPNTRMMAVPISITDEFRQLGPPREVFSGDYGSTYPIDSWDLAPDGRFIMPSHVPRPDASPITRINVALHWFAELNRLAPAKK